MIGDKTNANILLFIFLNTDLIIKVAIFNIIAIVLKIAISHIVKTIASILSKIPPGISTRLASSIVGNIKFFVTAGPKIPILAKKMNK